MLSFLRTSDCLFSLRPVATHPMNAHHSKTTIPIDVVQNAAEYIDSVLSILRVRGVSRAWEGAVCDAIGYLNNQCWTELADDRDAWQDLTGLSDDNVNGHDPYIPTQLLPQHFRCDPRHALRCAALCLRSRLRSLTWLQRSAVRFPLELLGPHNTALVSLKIDAIRFDTKQLHELTALTILRLPGGHLRDADLVALGELPHLHTLDLSLQRQLTDLAGLRNARALRDLSLQTTLLGTNAFAEIERMLSGLVTLDLSACENVTSVAMLAPCTSLRKLNLWDSAVTDLEGIERLVALESLNVASTSVCDWSFLQRQDVPRLQLLHLPAHIPHDFLHGAACHAARLLVHLDLRGCRLFVVPDLRHCVALRELLLDINDLTSDGIRTLADLPVLERLGLSNAVVTDVHALAGCPALRQLNLSYAGVLRDVSGLECIITLEKLNLAFCRSLTSVSNLRHSKALRELVLRETNVDDAGIDGLGSISTLTTLSLRGCARITDVSSLKQSAALDTLNLSNTKITAAGIKGLERIPTLQRLRVDSCKRLDSLDSLRSCPALTLLSASHTRSSVAALANIATLQYLLLRSAKQLFDVSGLSESRSLRLLDLSNTSVTDVGIAGLEHVDSLTTLLLDQCNDVTDVTRFRHSKSLRCLSLTSAHVKTEGVTCSVFDGN
jgi:Leucine-rich repeat (LRR) protein